jgi:hypothetical protein
MALVTFTSRAMDFRSGHEKFEVGASLDHTRVDRLPETGPTGATIELMLGGEERQVATGAIIDPWLMVFMQWIDERSLGIFVPQDTIGGRRELFSPFLIALRDLHDRVDLNFRWHQVSPSSVV